MKYAEELNADPEMKRLFCDDPVVHNSLWAASNAGLTYAAALAMALVHQSAIKDDILSRAKKVMKSAMFPHMVLKRQVDATEPKPE